MLINVRVQVNVEILFVRRTESESRILGKSDVIYWILRSLMADLDGKISSLSGGEIVLL